MSTLKQKISDYLEAQRPYYGDKEIEDNLTVLETQNDDLSNLDSLSKILILRLIDDNDLYASIASVTVKENTQYIRNTKL
ncbi:MAG: hypothetical protein ACJAYY_002510 [Paraglaciecola sp.]|jgi:hypothetical protein|uniref:hypothetical protein n=1 Tax=Polaribacter sp. TaxID=1920175 RepID=UPI003ABEE23C